MIHHLDLSLHGRPWLSRGSHYSGATCFNEFLSIAVTGGERRDHPVRCVDPTIAYAAGGVNDALTDEPRQRLLYLTPDVLECGLLPRAEAERVWIRLAGLARLAGEPWPPLSVGSLRDRVIRVLHQARHEAGDPIAWLDGLCEQWMKIAADEGVWGMIERPSADAISTACSLALGREL